MAYHTQLNGLPPAAAAASTPFAASASPAAARGQIGAAADDGFQLVEEEDRRRGRTAESKELANRSLRLSDIGRVERRAREVEEAHPARRGGRARCGKA